jgi:hypothetical protein
VSEPGGFKVLVSYSEQIVHDGCATKSGRLVELPAVPAVAPQNPYKSALCR